MARLTFLGAAGTVTGSRFFLEVDNQRLLIDCGLFQGRKELRLRNWESFPVPPASIDRVLLTHAHIDHSGFLPRLCGEGFSGPVHCTHATDELSRILLLDSARLQEEDARWANKKGYSKHKPALPLYTVKDAKKVIRDLTPLNYGESLYLSNLRVKFKDAGHILGSSFVEIRVGAGAQSRKLVFSGDLGRPEQPILRDPAQAFNVDYLVLESTYGNRLHPPGAELDDLARIIKETIGRAGVLLVPAFAVGRTQRLLYTLRDLEERGEIPSVPVYVDSPMAVDTTEVFERRQGDYDLSSIVLELSGKRILRPQQLHFTPERRQSKAINGITEPAIIISASGMATGGRILHHLAHRLPGRENTVLFIGYQAEGTRGRLLLDGRPSVKIHGREIPVRAHIESLSGFSAHADYNEILAWLTGFNRRPLKTFLVHGETEASRALAEKIREAFDWDVVCPGHGESFDLDL